MLTSNTAAGNNPKQIAVQTSTPDEVMYTVPSGRKFVGFIVNPSGYYNINGVNSYAAGKTGNYGYAAPELTFVEGTQISCISGNTTLMGVEYDA